MDSKIFVTWKNYSLVNMTEYLTDETICVSLIVTLAVLNELSFEEVAAVGFTRNDYSSYYSPKTLSSLTEIAAMKRKKIGSMEVRLFDCHPN